MSSTVLTGDESRSPGDDLDEPVFPLLRVKSGTFGAALDLAERAFFAPRPPEPVYEPLPFELPQFLPKEVLVRRKKLRAVVAAVVGMAAMLAVVGLSKAVAAERTPPDTLSQSTESPATFGLRPLRTGAREADWSTRPRARRR